MRRIRLVFALVALLLLVPLALLLHRALASVENERARRHLDAAERIVDAMEHELSAWLRVEEDRPYAHYRWAFVPETASAPGAPLARSPLADLPAELFVVGHFQIEPDGAVTSPLWPRDEARAREQLAWQPSDETRHRIDEVGAAVAPLWTSPAPKRAEPPSTQTAGTTIPLRKAKQELAEQQADDAASKLSNVLESFNRGVLSRRGRASKQEQTQAPNVYGTDDAASRLAAELEAGGLDAAQQRTATVDVRLEPMVGRPAADSRLVLYRTVLVDGTAFRQGVVLDVPELLDQVGWKVLAHSALSRSVRILPVADGAPSRADLEPYAYRHRFAEPFGGVLCDIALDPLPEPAGTLYLYFLTALLTIAATAGLFGLYRMVAAAVSYSERRNNFVSAVTHELKTPLTAIRMHVEMLRDGVVSSEEKRRGYYEILTAETERLSRLLGNVLELSRLERQERPMHLVAGDVAPVVEEVVGILGPHAEREGFRLRLEVEPGLPQVRFDRDALVQVLFNLLDNALKYSRRAAEKEVILRCRRQGAGVELAVADRGPGVPGPHLKKIFEPFYRGEAELTRTAKGTGIGLALVRGLVERMGGSVSGRNGPGGGFEVSVVLTMVI